VKALMGHEYVDIVEETGDDVTTIKSGQFVIGSFFASGNTGPLCQAGYQSRCVHSEYVGAGGAQAGGAVAGPAGRRHPGRRPRHSSDDLIPSLLTASDVLGTGWYGAVAAEAGLRGDGGGGGVSQWSRAPVDWSDIGVLPRSSRGRDEARTHC
jgi:threonine dehydrogenase-like Zn-dependent dehydrogenase